MLSIGAYSDVISLASIFAANANPSNPNVDANSLKFKCLIGESYLGKGNIWDGYIEILRAESLSLNLRMV